MARLITVSDLRAKFPFVIHQDVEDARLRFAIVSASKRLRSWIGDSAYDAAIAEISESSSSAYRESLASVYRYAAGPSPSREPKLPWPSISG